MSTIFRIYALQSSPLASFQPMNGDTNSEWFFAGRMAWAGENTKVTLVLIPSASSFLAAVTPASVAGILITKLGLMAAIFLASASIASASSRWGLISTDTGKRSYPSSPSDLIQSAMPWIAVRNGFPLSMICLGLVVTPSIPNVL